MYSLKLELKLNNKERSKLKGCAGFRRFVYNFGLSLVKDYWNFAGRKVSDSKIIDAVKKILTNDLMNSEQYKWMKSYPSTIYQSALQDLKTAFSRYRKGTSRLPVFKNKKKCDSFTVYKTSGIYLEKGQPALPFTNRVVLHSLKKIDIPGLGKFRTFVSEAARSAMHSASRFASPFGRRNTTSLFQRRGRGKGAF